MNEIIRKRKSIRKYDFAPLDEAVLDAVRAEIARVKPLNPDIKYSIEITSKTKGILGVKAPHFLIFSSEEKDGALENIGFIGQQLDLYFSANGLGSCWLGASKPGEAMESKLPYVIALAFGKPAQPLHRELSEFKRKPLSQISEGNDPRLEAARLAPSGVNMQNWHFIAEDGKIHCYLNKPNPVMGLMLGKMGLIDLGIAISHIAADSYNFNFTKEPNAPIRKGLIYKGTVSTGN
ncbi:MAG: nitroreductase [Oscillospiraceae bacterium]|nr:nitroreductase [Oscillospiraceae bacterium]MCL2278151.1 nitroreductase [Oscillospiraceae bacterium]